jgi:hypothetical protein
MDGSIPVALVICLSCKQRCSPSIAVIDAQSKPGKVKRCKCGGELGRYL